MHRAISIVMPVLGAILLVAAPARAQKGPFSLVSRQTVPISVDPGATATMVMLVSNHSDADAEATPTITLPTGWQVVTGSASFSLKAGETDALVISVGIPGGSPAGSYPIVIGSGGLAGATAWQTEPESVFVVVREHRSIGLVLLDKPPYAVAGENYEARLRVINRGNSTADVRMAARSSLGAARISPTTRLEPGASKEVVVSVALRDVAGNTADEVLAVTALHAADSSAKGDAAARIAIVPRVGRLDGFSTVSTMLRLRAAPANGGVAPFDITGGGRLSASGSSEISFSATGRSRGISRFGDRESYRLELRSTGYRARVGDHLYTLSSLTGSGQPGVGAAVEASAGLFGAGAYGQRFRSSPALGTESGAFVSVQSSAAPRARMTLNLVNRSRGPFEGRVASSEISLRPTSATLLDAEYAATGADASAYNTRFSGRLGFATLDMGHHRADTGFKGPQRGSSHDYLDLQAPVTERIRVAAFASRNSTRLTGTDSARSNAFANTGVSATLDNRFTVELSSLERSIGLVSDRQRALRLHSDVSFGRLSVTADGRLGISRDSATQATSLLRQFSVAPRLRLGRHSLAAHIGLSDVPNGPARNEAVTTLGLDASTRVGRTTEIGISGFGSHVASTGWIAQGDLR
ncbi:MAG: COG1470 family protein, partial [Gemmatimonadaceae bacterium]